MIEGVTRLYGEIWNEKDAGRSMEWLARLNARPTVRAAFAYSRFQNAPGKARDAEVAMRG
jgi:hypothetical protein